MRSVHILTSLAIVLALLAAWFAYRGLVVVDVAHGAAQFLAASGILMASAGWIFSNAVTLRLKLREQALDYLQTATERIVLQERAAEVNRAWLDLEMNEIVDDQEKLAEFWIANFPSHSLFGALRILANSYEQMGVAIKYGAVEEGMLRAYFGTSILWFYGRMIPLLPYYRNEPPLPGNPVGAHSNPKLFSHCEWLAQRWAGLEE